MNETELKKLMPRASASFFKANADSPTQSPLAEQAVRHEPLAADKGEKGNPGRVHVRVCSFRRRLIDPDNLCPKFFTDCLRYGGFIKDDTAKDIEIQTTQRKVHFKWDERTEITIERSS